uniref:Uncharacterized protein n=1 Tax=Arundo donax TaxID=35708 RepID=A0A0A9TKV0_ARUDO
MDSQTKSVQEDHQSEKWTDLEHSSLWLAACCI